MKKYDLIVLGTGSAGKSVADDAVKRGKKVAIIDKREFGGTCSQRGCDPKKVMVGVSQALVAAERFQGLGLTSIPKKNWKDLQAFKKTFTEPIPRKTRKQFKEKGIDAYKGTPTFISPHKLSIGKHQLQAKKILIATGMKPRPLDLPGAEHTINSEGFLELAELPKSMIIIGGGYIALEFAYVAHYFGCKVTILEKGERIGEPFEEFITAILSEHTRQLGIHIETNAQAASIKKKGKNYQVFFNQKNKTRSTTAALVLNASGRVPSIDDLGLEEIGLAHSDKGIEVNTQMRSTSHDHIYAAGDVADGGIPLTPVAGMESQIVVQNMWNKNKKKRADYSVIPSCIFTTPVVAGVGLTEKQAKGQKKKFKVLKNEVRDWFTARHLNKPPYGFKILVEKKTDKILGAHLIGPGAQDTINLFALSIKHNIRTKELQKMLFAYPTPTADIGSML